MIYYRTTTESGTVVTISQEEYVKKSREGKVGRIISAEQRVEKAVRERPVERPVEAPSYPKKGKK